jgi:uncharacterized lipoprotein YajG
MRMLAIVALAATLTACATTEEIVPIPYAPAKAAAVPGAESIQVTVVAVDSRTTNRQRISTKINGYGMEMAPIRSKEEVADVVRDALSAELKKRGYGLGSGGPKVEAKVVTFYSKFGVGILAGKSEANVDLTVTVTSAGGETLYTRELKGKADKAVQIAGGKNAAATLSAALADDFKTLFADEAFTKALAAK